MDPSTIQNHHQELSSQTLESMLVSTKPQQEIKKPRPPEETQKCPRCDSTNTKFCYYNNYSLSQPRYFCKSCRRYWTKGGTLRNVPVGGGCRKNKRSSSSKSSQEQSSINMNSPISNPLSSLTPFSYDSTDLSLAFARLQKQTSGHLGFENHNNGHFGEHGITPSSTSAGNFLGFLENAAPNNGFNNQNFYYGVDNMGNVENGGLIVDQDQMGMHHNYDQEISSGVTTTTATTMTTVKQEMCGMARAEGESNRVLWGFPWQINGDGNNLGDFDSSRRIWNGVGASSWHGLLNSPLM